MRANYSLILFFITALAFSQSAEFEIDEQVWKPFTIAWEANDANAFNAIHTDDVWRINPGRLIVGNEYKKRNEERMKGQVSNSIIEFSFETRTSNGNNAYEVGFYRITNKSETGTLYYVGRFHVALKKVDGQWKIFQDWDTNEINGFEITPESVQKRTFFHFN